MEVSQYIKPGLTGEVTSGDWRLFITGCDSFSEEYHKNDGINVVLFCNMIVGRKLFVNAKDTLTWSPAVKKVAGYFFGYSQSLHGQ